MCLREIISPKTNMYPKNEGLEDDVPFVKQMIFMFHLSFQGSFMQLCKIAFLEAAARTESLQMFHSRGDDETKYQQIVRLY